MMRYVRAMMDEAGMWAMAKFVTPAVWHLAAAGAVVVAADVWAYLTGGE